MTWIVGAEGMLGYGVGLSDIRVTLSDGREIDCLQKIYGVGNFLAAGFAGSVAIGFALVDRLTELLTCGPEGAWDPVAVAEWWPQDAREIFDRFPKDERELQSHMILVAAHPSEDTGPSGWSRNYVYTFRSPDFRGLRCVQPEVAAIGCGSNFEPCRAAVQSLSKNHDWRFTLMKAELGCRGGMATLLGFHLTELLRETRPAGVSAHLHCCWVYRGKIVIAPTDYASKGRWSVFSLGVEAAEQALADPEKNRPVSPGMEFFRMPPVAKSLKELEAMLQRQGLSAARAIG